MKYFLKLNALSMLYAFMLWIPIELMLNVYRLSRLTGWPIDKVNLVTAITTLAIFIVGTVAGVKLTGNWLGSRNANYWLALLWFPYFVLFTAFFALSFPITYPGDAANPATGLLLIAALIGYPLYLLLLVFFANDTEADFIQD